MAAVRAVQPDMVARRLGLRYINSIDRPGPNPTDWENLISDGLLAKLGATVKQGAAKLYEKRGRWYLALSISVQVTPCVGTKVAGVDLGLRNLAVVNCEGETLFFSGDRAAFVRRKFNALRRRVGKAKALGAIRRMKDKANLAGIKVEWVVPANTSRTCPACGVVDQASRRGIRFRCTACGHTEHADSVGAANIARAISGLAAA